MTFTELKELNIPYVIVGDHFEEINADEIYADDLKGGYIATQQLIKKGGKKIIFLDVFSHNFVSYSRLSGYKKALEENNLPFRKELVFKVSEDTFSAYKKTLEIIENKIDFDSIFCFNDILAYGALKALREKKLKVPRDVKIVGYDDIIYSSIIDLTTVKIPKFEMGYKAFNLLLEKIHKKTKTQKKIVLDVELIKRKTG